MGSGKQWTSRWGPVAKLIEEVVEPKIARSPCVEAGRLGWNVLALLKTIAEIRFEFGNEFLLPISDGFECPIEEPQYLRFV